MNMRSRLLKTQSLFNIVGAARYLIYSLLFLNLPCRVVVWGAPLLTIGFKRIKFLGGNKIFPGSRFEVFHNGELVIGKGVQIGQYCHITCSEKIIIGENTAIAGGAVITDIHHPFSPQDIPPLERPCKVRPVVIGRSCFIGYGAVILPGAIIGDGAYIGANVTVKGSIAPHSIVKNSG